MSEPLSELRLLIHSRHPIITMETDEEQRAMDRVGRAIVSLSMKGYVWNLVDGLKPIPPLKGEPIAKTAKPVEVLAHIKCVDWPAVFVLLDMCPHLDDPALERIMRSFTQGAQKRAQTIVMIDPATKLPRVLERWSVPLDMGLPSEKEL